VSFRRLGLGIAFCPKADGAGTAEAELVTEDARTDAGSRAARCSQEDREHLQYLREYVSVLQGSFAERDDLERLYIRRIH